MSFLISQGHKFSDIQQYTPGQLGVFIKNATKQKEDNDKAEITNAWIANNADQKYIDKNIIKKSAKSITESPGFLNKVIKVKKVKKG